MVPLRAVVGAVGPMHAVRGRDRVPAARCGRTRASDSAHVDGKAVAVERVELVPEAADAERGRAVGGHQAGRNTLPAGLAHGPSEPHGKHRVNEPDGHGGPLPAHGASWMGGRHQVAAGVCYLTLERGGIVGDLLHYVDRRRHGGQHVANHGQRHHGRHPRQRAGEWVEMRHPGAQIDRIGLAGMCLA